MQTIQSFYHAVYNDSTKPRGQWKLARTVDRSHYCATLKLPNGQTITRPFNLLYPLELPSSKTKVSEHITENTTGHPTSTDEKRARKPQRLHPMITQSLKRSASSAFLTIIQLLLSTASADITSYTPPNTKCASRPQTINTIIYADQCISQGIAVTTSITKDRKPSFCWLPLMCPLGHIRSPVPKMPNTGFCGSKCPCPSWTTSCSAYNGRLAKNSTFKNTPFAIAHFIPHRVCSFTQAEHCSKERKIGAFYQIELYDSTLILVPDLHVRTAEFLHKDDYYCFDHQGNEFEDRSRTMKRLQHAMLEHDRRNHSNSSIVADTNLLQIAITLFCLLLVANHQASPFTEKDDLIHHPTDRKPSSEIHSSTISVKLQKKNTEVRTDPSTHPCTQNVTAASTTLF
ncbi:hypothetical protein RB195_025344 [Necator americanus]|uniref:Uncharacterized protein n=1 Tax=Necator americanus TaxID=51031 RepID=A0ABR1ERX8_NECAM